MFRCPISTIGKEIKMNNRSRIRIFAFFMALVMLMSSAAAFASPGGYTATGQTGADIFAMNTAVSAAVYRVHITQGSEDDISRGGERTFRAVVRTQQGVNLSPQPTITWSSTATTTSGGTTTTVSNSSNWINSNGLLTIPSNAPVGARITITASSSNATSDTMVLFVAGGAQATVTFNLGPNMNVRVDDQQLNNVNRFTRQRTIGNNFGTLPDVTGRSNFTLAGWFEDGNINDRFTANTRVDGNMSVSALWNPTGSTRTITFEANGGTWPNGPWPGNLNASGGGTANRQITVGTGTNNNTLASRGFSGNATVAFENFNMIPTRSGFNFDGWERSNGNILAINDAITENITVTARWVPRNAITLTFNPQGGTWSDGTTGNRTYYLPRNSSFSSQFGADALANRIGVPTRTGYNFDGWVIGNTTNSFTNTTVVNPAGNATTMTINATWSSTAAPPPPPPPPPPPVQFRDVPANAWFASYVNTVVTRNLFHGMGDGIFAPNQSMTRAMFVQVIHNMAGNPASSPTTSFVDVPANAWFAQAVSWASNQGIVNGVGPNTFDPHAPITREQMAVMLLNYTNAKNVSLPTGTPVTFADQGSISSWARSSVDAVSAAGIVSGRAGNNFEPRATATRAEVAAIFSRYLRVTGQ